MAAQSWLQETTKSTGYFSLCSPRGGLRLTISQEVAVRLTTGTASPEGLRGAGWRSLFQARARDCRQEAPVLQQDC